MRSKFTARFASSVSESAPPRGLGLMLVAIGTFFCAIAVGWISAPAESFNAPREVVLCAGLVFAIGGLSASLGPTAPEWITRFLAACLWTVFAAVPSWIAWGAGPRNFSGDGLWLLALVGLDFQSLGRTVFGLSALLLWLCAFVAWRTWLSGLPLTGRVPALVAMAAFAYWLGWGRYLEPPGAASETDADRLARYIERKHANSDFGADNPFLQPREEHWVKSARTRLAAARAAPPGVKITDIPQAQAQPELNGLVDDPAWRNAHVLAAKGDRRGGRVLVMRYGGKLYIAGEAFADSTEKGFDQMRVYFHIDLTPALLNERVFLSGSGGVTSLRSVRLPNAKHEETEWRVLHDVQGASAVGRHRQFELAIDIAEAGLPNGGVFPFFVEIEGDPIRTAAGKFHARRIEGRVGTHEAPVWLRLAK